MALKKVVIFDVRQSAHEFKTAISKQQFTELIFVENITAEPESSAPGSSVSWFKSTVAG